MDILDIFDEPEPEIDRADNKDFIHPGIFDSELYKLGVDNLTRKNCIEWYEPSVWGWLLKYFEVKHAD